MSERVVVVGADAAGMSAASQAKRLRGDDLEVVAFERGRHTSYSACGIPYWVGGDVGSVDDLVARTPAEHRANGIDLRMRSEVDGASTSTAARSRSATTTASTTYRLGFDQLVIATGARPRPARRAGRRRRRHLRRADARRRRRGCWTRWGTRRARRSSSAAATSASRWPRRWCAAASTSPSSTRSAEPMATLDPDMGRLVHDGDGGHGHRRPDRRSSSEASRPTTPGTCAPSSPSGGTHRRPTSSCSALGVAPETALADATPAYRSAGRGGLVTDLQMRVFDPDGVWAGGRLRRVHRPGRPATGCTSRSAPTPTSRAGCSGTNLGGGYATFPGVVGTAVSKVCDLEIARTGLREADCDAAGFACADRHGRVDDPGRLLPRRGADDGQDARRAAHRAAARRRRSSAGRARPSGSTRSRSRCGTR